MKRSVSVVALCLLLSAATAFAGPPHAADDAVTDDAVTVAVGSIEVELNGSYAYSDRTNDGVNTQQHLFDGSVKIITGLYKDWAISLEVPYTFSERVRKAEQLDSDIEGFGDMTLEVKWAFAELAGIKFAIKPTVIIPTGRYSAGLSEGRWQPGVVLIATREFEGGTYALHANLGYEHHSYRTGGAQAENRSGLLSGSIAGEAVLLKGLFITADFGLSTNQDKTSNVVPVYAMTGASYEINKHLDANVGIKVGLTRAEDDVTALYGLVLKF
ncbi:transporter [Trichlorobacter ammonificans]|uniref:Transporter n=1 Tax=Trichlorobacter ammonificans TaxID=2916410 RepID=A0ABM9D3X9_9BACT|nr:transporter [Trichlorobacter ammonificans]CAH2029966.1 conserved exported protein of unknown function [Trichlorobacter ammonificans]